MSSWYESWADRYAEWTVDGTDDVPFYVALACEADGLLVELAVGNGRVAIPVAQETGRRVVGIDSSPAMLAQARERAVEAGVELDLREGDIRELEIEEPAALIYCPGRSLLHLPTWADRRRCFERVAASLRPDGRFAWNAFAFDHQTASAIDGKHADTPMPHTVLYSVGENRCALVGNQKRMAGTPRCRGPAAGSSLWRIRRGAARRQQPRVRFRSPPLSAPPGRHHSARDIPESWRR